MVERCSKPLRRAKNRPDQRVVPVAIQSTELSPYAHRSSVAIDCARVKPTPNISCVRHRAIADVAQHSRRSSVAATEVPSGLKIFRTIPHSQISYALPPTAHFVAFFVLRSGERECRTETQSARRTCSVYRSRRRCAGPSCRHDVQTVLSPS